MKEEKNIFVRYLKRFVISGIFVCLLFVGTVIAIDTQQTGYQVDYGQTKQIDTPEGCKKVTNNHASGLSIFVPTKTAPEWSSFSSHLPPGVTIADCVACGSGGYYYKGACWYMEGAVPPNPYPCGSAVGCQTTCASRGGYSNATRDVAGSGGTLADCLAIANGMGISYASSGDVNNAGYGDSDKIGCHVDARRTSTWGVTRYIYRAIGAETRADTRGYCWGDYIAGFTRYVVRICACNE